MKLGLGFRNRLRGDLGPAGQEIDLTHQALVEWREAQHDVDGGHTDITADTFESTGLTSFGGPWQIPEEAILTPPQIVAAQNNYHPAGGEDRIVWRLSTDASRAITGMYTDPRYNRWLWLINIGNFDVTISHNSASSFALYRIGTPLGATVTVGSGGIVCLYYDVHAGNWRVVAGAGSITGLSPGEAPTSAEYLVGSANSTLSAERVVTDTATVAWDLGTAAQAKAAVPNDAITYAKIQNISAASKLLGRGSAAGGGDTEEITIGTGLTMSGTTISSSASVSTNTRVLTWVIDGGGAVISTGAQKPVRVPVTGTLTGWTLLADQSGSIQLDVWKDTFAHYPPDNSDSITNGHEPAISSATSNEDIDITDWTTTAVTAGDVLKANVDSATTVTWAVFELYMTVS